MHIWQQPNWPRFTWSYEALFTTLAAVQRQQGRLLGQIEGLGFIDRQKAIVEALTEEVVKTSEIEGEQLDEHQVRSSIARKLQLPNAGITKQDHAVEGIVDLMIDATRNAKTPLSKERLWQWHRLLFPKGAARWSKIRVGQWRTEPMMIISGTEEKHKTHFEAPPAASVDAEMSSFIDWFETTDVNWIMKAAISHIWFESIHPFEDGNGRIGRAIADLCLARSDEMSQRFYSMSARIRKDRSQYYDMLERSQKGSLDITGWIDWFLGCLSRAIDDSQTNIQIALHKQAFWLQLTGLDISDRQRKVLNKWLDESKTTLKSSDYGRIGKCSPDTALRDISDLIDKGILFKDESGGRSTKYVIRHDMLRPK